MFEPPPLRVRGKDLRTLLTSAYQRLAGEDPAGDEPAGPGG